MHSISKNLSISIMISVLDYGGQSCADWFEPLNSIQMTDISALPIQSKVAAVREQDFDITIDLSGWTSGHFLVVFSPSGCCAM